MLICNGKSRAYKDFSCYARPQHCQAEVQREPGKSPRNLERKKESARRRNLKPGQNQKRKKLGEKDAAKEHGAHGITPKEHRCDWRKTHDFEPPIREPHKHFRTPRHYNNGGKMPCNLEAETKSKVGTAHRSGSP